MVDATHISFPANDRSYFSLLKKEIHKKVLEAGMEASRVAEVDIIVAEITSNLFKYADEGEILFGSFTENGTSYIELISLDKGPGMTKVFRMLEDGMQDLIVFINPGCFLLYFSWFFKFALLNQETPDFIFCF